MAITKRRKMRMAKERLKGGLKVAARHAQPLLPDRMQRGSPLRGSGAGCAHIYAHPVHSQLDKACYTSDMIINDCNQLAADSNTAYGGQIDFKSVASADFATRAHLKQTNPRGQSFDKPLPANAPQSHYSERIRTGPVSIR
jgi:hypothetical protein